MPMPSMLLVATEQAEKFFTAVRTDTAMRVMFGDPARYTGATNNHVEWAWEAVRDGVDKVERLKRDATRTEPVKHEAARTIANRVNETLAQAQAGIARTAAKIDQEAWALADDRLSLNNSISRTNDRIHDWIAGRVERPNGIMEIMRLVKADRDVAAVVHNTKPFLLGMGDDAHTRIVGFAMRHHAPKAVELIGQAGVFAKWAGRYPQLQRDVNATFFNAAMANRAADSRVEID